MPDLSASWDIPNVFGLLAVDFGYDLTGYKIALGFLSDLAGGTKEPEALANNGGNPGLLVAWQHSDKFRRVLGKCRAAGEAERDALAARESASAATDESPEANPPAQRFIPLEDMPVSRSVFTLSPSPASYGQA